jgi:histidinol-phosphate/aromatic aminotransferase/cobyric acid decarboxylase-like protein
MDDVQDLDIAESIFTQSDEDKLTKIQKRYGGYWRYPNLIDFCYLVNPFYPPTKLIDEIKANFERLICEYPSGQDVNNLLAAKYFDIDEKHIVVGNGAAELIKTLMEYFDGNIGITLPTFEEYPNRKHEAAIIEFYSTNNNFSYSVRDLINFYEKEKITTLILVNPDNPSGNYIPKNQVVELLEWARNRRIKLVVDESFIDFVDQEDDASILTDDILNDYPNLVVIKSISKSFGVPGLRLGILASSNDELINYIKKHITIWNINSFAEFYLQIFEKYKHDYKTAIEKFIVARKEFMEKLVDIPYLRIIPSQANFIMCEIVEKIKAKDLTRLLLDRHNILIKDLSSKNGIKGEYIRIAVKKPEENNKLIEAINMIIQNNKIN